MPKASKPSNNDFCPQCGQTFPRDQRDYHILNHLQAMNKELLGALENLRQEFAQHNQAHVQTA